MYWVVGLCILGLFNFYHIAMSIHGITVILYVCSLNIYIACFYCRTQSTWPAWVNVIIPILQMGPERLGQTYLHASLLYMQNLLQSNRKSIIKQQWEVQEADYPKTWGPLRQLKGQAFLKSCCSYLDMGRQIQIHHPSHSCLGLMRSLECKPKRTPEPESLRVALGWEACEEVPGPPMEVVYMDPKKRRRKKSSSLLLSQPVSNHYVLSS